MFRSTLLSAALVSAALVLGTLSASAAERLTPEQGRALVAPFYALLSGEPTEGSVRKAISADWRSHYSIDGSKGLDETLGFLTGPLRAMVPDLKWRMVDVSIAGDDRIVVIGEATGTPVGDKFFGAPVTGKSFKIMSIDVHEVKDGKVVVSHHIEDWAGAYNNWQQRSSVGLHIGSAISGPGAVRPL